MTSQFGDAEDLRPFPNHPTSIPDATPKTAANIKPN
jgi:hypothetical protein